MDKILSRYEAMNALSEEMARASESMDWDLLISLEKKQSEIMNELIKEKEIYGLALDQEEETQKTSRRLIESILSNNKIVCSYVSPWMESVKIFLSNNGKKTPSKNASIIKAYDLGS